MLHNTNRAYWPTADWRTVPPESMGMNAERLIAADRAVRVKLRGVNAFLVVKNGYLVFEQYYEGFNQHDGHHVASVTKSITSALVGIAIAKGCIEGVAQKVLDFFPEFPIGPRDDLKRSMTIKHLLTMTAGFHWCVRARGFEPMLDRLWRSKDWVEFILNLPVKDRGFGKFQYNSAASHLLSAILTRATTMCAREFANKYLFEPIGASPIPAAGLSGYRYDELYNQHTVQWLQDPQGNNTGGWGLVLKPRDMARFGYLYLNEGHWDGQQLIPRQWIHDSITAHTPGYGYQWWLREVNGMFV